MNFHTPLKDIKNSLSRDWTLKIDGKEVPGVKSVELSNPSCGTLIYGEHPEGYDTWFFHENGGGGEIAILYFKDSVGLLHISLIKENRINMDGENYCAIGGFFDPKDTNKEFAIHRETKEETGLETKLEKLPGLVVNTNRAVFITNADEGQGLSCYSAEISLSDVERDHKDKNLYRFKNHITDNPKTQRTRNIRFVPWYLLQNYTSDGFMYILAYKLLVKLNYKD